MRDSKQLEGLEATRGALSASKITAEHARILGTAAQCGPMDEAKMLAAAEIQTPERLRRTMHEYQDEFVGDYGTSSQRPPAPGAAAGCDPEGRRPPPRRKLAYRGQATRC
ncbi:MAG: hypothetical protein OXG30_01995 [bacterium]|nr:hypothetical protein [bacterium]